MFAVVIPHFAKCENDGGWPSPGPVEGSLAHLHHEVAQRAVHLLEPVGDAVRDNNHISLTLQERRHAAFVSA